MRVWRPAVQHDGHAGVCAAVLPPLFDVFVALAISATSAASQSPLSARIGAHAIGIVTRADPALLGEKRTEAYITQPMLLARASAWQDRLVLSATINFEGWTLDRGELALGNAGEGYVDRRHPHTFLHELMLTGFTSVTGVDASLAFGRGFVPFGTDDPMARPFAKYPANHHWSQILERYVLAGAIRRGRASVEAGLFNGDEPIAPDDLGRLSRFADSWAARLTLRPVDALEMQASYAFVESPEHVLGGGLDQRKWSASARWDARALAGCEGAACASIGLPLYALVEWAETYEYSGDRQVFLFTTVLAEAAYEPDAWHFAARFERTTRPEEERLFDPFRSARPHGDENIIGVTRWNTVSLRVARTLDWDALSVQPFVEAALAGVREITGAIFRPVEFYGNDRLWNLSVGAKVRFDMQHRRMGRYGAALPASHDHGM
ncbi:MAG: hypothetical protein ACREL7_05075 [Longimicrobiales bacterium]